jgi:hypothetical protein
MARSATACPRTEAAPRFVHTHRGMRKTLALAVGLIASVAVSVTTARADAIVRSQAMLASTIAEFFITEDGVAVELEI